VHDDNAWAMGGVAGHAGFSARRAVYGALWRNSQGFIMEEYPQRFSRARSSGSFFPAGDPGSFVLGFDTQPGRDRARGVHFRIRASATWLYGHVLLAGLEKEAIVVLLTNRVHPDRGNEGIKAFRPMIHDAVMEALGRG